MGHLTPALRLAALLLRPNLNCRITLITAHPTVSLAESHLISRFLSSFPHVSHVQLHLLSLDSSTVATDDPFLLHFESTRRSSAQLLSPLLSSLSDPPLSALIFDVSLITPVASIAESLSLPCYTLFTSSYRMLSLFAHFPTIPESVFADVTSSTGLKIPGLVSPMPWLSLPPQLLNRNSFFANVFLTDAPELGRLNGVLINTFEGLETDSVREELDYEGKIPVFAVGPFLPYEFEFESESDSDSDSNSLASAAVKWLDKQPEGTVVYLSFGSRTALTRGQMREVAKGLVLSGCRFLWVVKDKKVDKEEEEGNVLDEVIEKEVMEMIKEKGLVVKTWVDQSEILGHKAVGGFVSHCGWNSVVESAWHGVRILAWPQHGDQKVNAEVVRDCGMGMWVESWGWSGGDQTAVVKGEEIGERIRAMMGSEMLRLKAANVGEKAKKAAEVGGSREMVFKRLVDEWKNKM